ncbi:DnaJ domain-containing protein [Solihabitans fulvus]|uniref:DnaJ domain-containing protein n=1 Tax=Solihabitans fulvus TaxID=1892852 RepID=A0A5B2XM30_9PSEU|nr:DnaJ domain-containing protein [Solihabitans fulvus]
MHGVDYYELLGVARTASDAEIKSAYRSLVKVMHPDAGGTSGTFRLLQQAYETLNDPAQRAVYDLSRAAPPQPPQATPTAPARPRPRPRATGKPSRPKDFGEDPNFVPPQPRLDPSAISWWQNVDIRQRVRLVPLVGPGHRPLLAALGAALALAVLLLVVDLPVPLLVGALVLLAAALVATVWLGRDYLAAVREDREFTTEFGGHPIFGRPGKEAAQVAERLTAKLLAQYLTRLPGVRIFHGLAWPDSVFADVDHAVLCGQRLVLIESKMWLPGHYVADDEGALWRNGHPFRGGAVRLPEGVSAFRELLPDVEVRGAVLIYPSRAGEITSGESPEVPAPPMSPRQFVEEIGAWLAEEPATVDRELFRLVLAQVVS